MNIPNQNVLQINIFSTYPHRLPLIFSTMDQLRITKNKDKVFVKIFTTSEMMDAWTEKVSSGYVQHVIEAEDKNYMRRTRDASQSPFPFSCRVDDDLFIPAPLWDFLIDNLNILDDPSKHCLSPIFSTGIPSCEWFIDDFFSPEEAKEIRCIFKEVGVPEVPWHPHCNYWHINERIKKMDTWDVEAYWDEVQKHNTEFRSIHPIRFDSRANEYLFNVINKHIHKMFEPQDYKLMERTPMPNTHPFIFKTKTWQEALQHSYDNFDEISLYQHCVNNNLSLTFVRNGFTIHPCHGYVPNREEIEKKYAKIICDYQKQKYEAKI